MKRFQKITITIIMGVLCSLSFGEVNDVNDHDLNLLKQIATMRSELTHVQRRRYENLSLADLNKTAGIIQELLNRSEQFILETLPPGRYPWSWDGFDKPAGLIENAREFLSVLSTGTDPLAGKFAEPGGYVTDHALIQKDNKHHLIYIRGIAVTNWPEFPLFNFGHAVSTDLINWRVEKPVLQCPESGWDEYQVWAPHIIEHDGEYWMFYTGVNKNGCQAIGLAKSKDLYQWQRYENNPVIKSGSWGQWDPNTWSDCRDPMVLQDGNTFYCYYTAARINPDTQEHEYCVGVSSSKDLYHWKDEGFIRLEYSLKTPPESCYAIKKDGTYYLIYTNYKHGIVYAQSSDPVKDWVEPKDKMVIMVGVSATEPYQVGDQWYISLISHMKNGLHFFEIRKLIWNPNGTFSVQPI